MKDNLLKGHLLAIFTIIVWGTTFISTKILLRSFSPIEILLIRFILGFAALAAIYPHRLKIKDKRQELTFALAGLTGVCMYFLMENIALTYTTASNASVIVSSVPLFSVLLNYKNEKPSFGFFIGFVLSMAGICIISYGSAKMQINPLGDLLTLCAAVTWAVYSVLTKKISSYGYNMVQSTRRIFLYGIIFMLPFALLMDFSPDIHSLLNGINIFNFVFLGFGASALCFVTWNSALKVLGSVTTCIYIYAQPIITVATSVLVLHEKITLPSAIGTVLTLAGLIISQQKSIFTKKIKAG